MRSTTSLYLDAVRLTAALTVMLGHLSGARFTGGFLWQFGPFMEDAVTVFFVLSGYVIAFATDTPRRTPGAYAAARIARVASVALPALLLTFTLDATGSFLRPDLYTSAWGYSPDAKLWQYLCSIFFLNQIWFNNVAPGSNLPYWSLSYECWYYVIFGVFVFAPHRLRIPVIAGLVCFIGPKLAAGFPLWMAGVLAYRVCKSRRLARSWGIVLALGAPVLCCVYFALCRTDVFGIQASGIITSELGRAYVVALLFAVQLIGVDAVASTCDPPRVLSSALKWLAGATFSIYLYHLPVGQFLTAIVPWPPSSLETRLVILGGTLTLVFLLAEVTERRKAPWRRLVDRAFAWTGRALHPERRLSERPVGR